MVNMVDIKAAWRDYVSNVLVSMFEEFSLKQHRVEPHSAAAFMKVLFS